jgi:flavin reductase (DIM6/NTAB) family NADH-FMN oxidoreductase RutF
MPDAFDSLMSSLRTPMMIVTTTSGGERAGCLVGFGSQVSIDPKRFLVGLSNRNRTYRVAREADTLVVHVVPEEARELAELFGGETGDEVDKFARCAWRPGPGGAPVLDGCPSWFAGRVLERIDFGDHVGFVLEPVAVERGPAGEELTLRRARTIEPGHEP